MLLLLITNFLSHSKALSSMIEEFRESLPDIILGYELVLIFDCNQRRTILI